MLALQQHNDSFEHTIRRILYKVHLAAFGLSNKFTQKIYNFFYTFFMGKLIKQVTLTNKELKSVVERMNATPSSNIKMTEKGYNSSTMLLTLLKGFKKDLKEIEILDAEPVLQQLVSENINLAYKIEKKARILLYDKEANQPVSELAKNMSTLSKKLIANDLYATKST